MERERNGSEMKLYRMNSFKAEDQSQYNYTRTTMYSKKLIS